MGGNSVYLFDGMDEEQSIKSTKSTLSMPIAPKLHQEKYPNQLVWRLDSILYNAKLFLYLGYVNLSTYSC